ncbi:MAG TPA: hypothetical protein VH439_00970 [Gemmatimonadales bacterium]
MKHALVLAALALLCPRPALPQQAPPPPERHRRGLWGEFGSGPGYVRLACSGCSDIVEATGATSYLRIGGVISRKVVIGFEVFTLLDDAFGFTPQDTSATAETGTAAIIVMWYPGRHGLYLKGGVGAAFGEFSIPADSGSGRVVADTSTGGGMGLTFGVGWDIAISRKFALTANAATFVTALGDVVTNGRRVDDLIATMYQLSIGFTIR